MSADTGTSWSRCPGCANLVYGRRLQRTHGVCPGCGHHTTLTAPQRIAQLTDEGSFSELRHPIRPRDPLGFVDSKPYRQRLADARRKTGLEDAVVCGTATIAARPVVLAVMDFRFLGGSLGSAVGELITHAAETALQRRVPLLLVTASGGARMQEGAMALMQMAKTSQAIARLREAGVLTISLITDPTYGGVAASFATNCDILVAEPRARLGFAGRRVIRDTIGQDLPADFQTAEFLLAHGQLDMVVERAQLRRCLGQLLAAGRAGTTLEADTGPSVVVTSSHRLAERDPWDVVRAARERDRPTVTDYLEHTFDAFVELRGDRLHGDCPAVTAGFAFLAGICVAVVGTRKGHTTADLVAHNFGMPRPEGYRKALRVMKLAARLGLPVVTLIDTPGAFPGLDAEERGQALAIAENVREMSGLRTPVVAVVTGEGGSGGALALAVADRVLMLENATYSVISPEGCSAILWRGAEEAAQAARAMQVTAPSLLDLGIVDGVVPEPEGGAHRDRSTAAAHLRAALLEVLPPLLASTAEDLVDRRRARYRAFGSDVVVAEQARTGPLSVPVDSRAA